MNEGDKEGICRYEIVASTYHIAHTLINLYRGSRSFRGCYINPIGWGSLNIKSCSKEAREKYDKPFVSLILAVVTVMGLPLPSHAEGTYSSPKKDSAQLQYQYMLMLFLLPHIDEAVRGHYIHTLKGQPLD
ncbi:DUF3888 domain-containing protein [Paenibacillus sp. ISL-20]|uniref:DUF3888 domain-containing protein n=1 Tax=Paenibacillus sp. ISL-20 TaxID=2819163 RepID=UPI001C18680E|nr:DUF3888 domain-containing protein [Paenibacillus sp. ISL-20]MBT2764390.1 hypothetical protein [Paenibacillus sp. ISL-20]